MYREELMDQHRPSEVKVSNGDEYTSDHSEEALQRTSQQFQVFVDTVSDYAFILISTEGLITAWNVGAERLLGYTESEVLGRPTAMFFTPEDIETNEPQKEMETALRKGRAEDERWHARKDGSRFFADGVLTVLREPNGQVTGFAKVLRDYTNQKKAEEALRASEERFRLVVENVRDYALFQVDLDGKVSSWNPGAERVLGYSSSEILGSSIELLSTPEDVAARTMQVELERARANGRAEDARWLVRSDGIRIWCQWITNAIYDDAGREKGFVKVLRDETERRRTDEQIRASLREKEALLQEIHHRVKNNLQVIISLLNIQAGYMEDPRSSAMFEETCNRLFSIAEIHELLYSSHELARVDMSEYIRRLAAKLFMFYGIQQDRIALHIEPATGSLPIGKAVPCGLVVNELLVNSLKYAFPDGRSGRITVAFQEEGEDSYLLRVRDNGVGLQEGVNWTEAKSMGLSLVRVLANQLHGTLELEPTKVGVSFALRFPGKPQQDGR